MSDIPILHWVEIFAPDVPSDAVGQQSSPSKPEVIKSVLDGGHNMLAIGALILSRALDDPKLIKKIKLWPDLKTAWEEHRAAVEKLRKAEIPEGEAGPLDFLVPLGILVPSYTEDDEVVVEFNSSLLDICAARNNNVELTLETKTNERASTSTFARGFRQVRDMQLALGSTN